MAARVHKRPGGSGAGGYGKIDSAKSRDIMTETGKSKGLQNNPGDFGNDNDGQNGVDVKDQAAVDRRRDQASNRSKPRRAKSSFPYPS
jgi:hypothetical protein